MAHSNRRRSLAVALVVVAMAAAACAPNDDSTVLDEGTTVQPPGNESESSDDSSDDDAPDDDTVEDGASEGEPADEPATLTVSTETVSRNYPTFGGVRLETPIDVSTFNDDDYISIRPRGISGRIIVARAGATVAEDGILTINDLNDAVARESGVEGQSTSDTLEILGRSSTLYEYRSDLVPSAVPSVIGSAPLAAPSNVSWSPLPNANLWLVETATGVLAVGSIADDEETLATLQPLLDQVVESIALVNGDILAFDPELPIGLALNEPVEPTPVSPNPDGPPALIEVFAPVEAGAYQVVNLPSLPTVSVPDDWFIAPNFPGFVVATRWPTEGPGDGDITMMDSLDSIGPNGLGKRSTVERSPLAGPEGLRAIENLIVLSEDATDVGGQPASVVDLAVINDAECTDASPCSFGMYGSAPFFAQFFSPGHRYRIWFVEQPNGGVLAITAGIPEAESDWLDDQANGFVDSITFDESAG